MNSDIVEIGYKKIRLWSRVYQVVGFLKRKRKIDRNFITLKYLGRIINKEFVPEEGYYIHTNYPIKTYKMKENFEIIEK